MGGAEEMQICKIFMHFFAWRVGRGSGGKCQVEGGGGGGGGAGKGRQGREA